LSFQTRLARIGYVLGTALAVAAILYFFSSNWGGLPRGAKTLLAACMTAGFYALAFVPAALPFWRKHGDFLPLVFLFAGVMAFGGTVALLNGIYNAHADEWRMFAVWFVPALLFSVLLRNVWFYALTYAIGHLALYFTFYPGMYFIQYTDWETAGIIGLFGAVNLLLYMAAERGLWRAGFVRPLSLAVFLFAAVWLSNSFVLNGVGHWLNLLSVAVLAACFLLFGKRRDSLALSLTGLAASFYAVLKFLELMEEHFSELFFFFGLVFVALLLTANVLFFRYVARLGAGTSAASGGVNKGAAPQAAAHSSSPDHVRSASGDGPDAGPDAAAPAAGGVARVVVHPADGTPGDGGNGTSARRTSRADDSGDRASAGSTAARVVGNIVTIVGTVIGAVSLIGLIMLLGEAWDQPGLVVFAVSVLLIALMAFLPRLHPTVRNTGLMIGLIAGNFSVFPYQEIWVNLAVLALGILCWFRVQGTGVKLVVHFIAQLTFVFFGLLHLEWYGNEFVWILVILAAVNAVVYALHERVANPALRRPLELGSPLFMLAALFGLTFFEDVFTGSHALFNALFFVLATGLLVLSVRRRRQYDTTLSMVFWLLFVGFKYYDWLWDLLHKSLTMLLGGLILIALSALLDRRAERGTAQIGSPDAAWANGADPADGSSASTGQTGRPARLLPYRRLAAVLAILVLQFGYIGGEIIARENLIARGTTVQLAVHPDDLAYYRSGGATWVRYTISELPEPMARELRESGMAAGKRIRLVLRPDVEGVYQIDRFYREGETVRAGEVVINGRFDGWGGIRYGIESRDPDRDGGRKPSPLSPIVQVRISANGNAMLEE
jgi:hypothetical protein